MTAFALFWSMICVGLIVVLTADGDVKPLIGLFLLLWGLIGLSVDWWQRRRVRRGENA
jgi:hypothetical protein